MNGKNTGLESEDSCFDEVSLEIVKKDTGLKADGAGEASSDFEKDFRKKFKTEEKAPAFGLTDLLMILTTMVWGANVSVIKRAFSELPPHAFNLARFMLSALIFAVIIWRSGEGFKVSRRDWPRLLFLAATGITLYQVFFINGLSRTSASLVSMANAMTPIFIAVLSTVLGFDRLRWTGWLGILLSVLGFYGIVLGRPNGFNLKGADVSGAFLILLAGLMWAFYTIFAKPILKNISPLKLAALTNLIGTVFYLPFAWKEFAAADFSRVTLGGWLGLVYSASLALVFGFVVWYKSVERVGGARTGVYSNLTPVFGVLTAVIFLGDRISGLQILSVLVIFLGVYLTRNGHNLFKKKVSAPDN
ncbi:MAG: DMT family transporter [Candidatus Aminicenantes bacterium]|nr:DMT family transporter [Candidatus Aminicenantes bacterium]